MKRFWILGFGFWITAAVISVDVAFAATPKPTPTPTPKEHKLSGGFGRGAPDAACRAAGDVTPAPEWVSLLPTRCAVLRDEEEEEASRSPTRPSSPIPRRGSCRPPCRAPRRRRQRLRRVEGRAAGQRGRAAAAGVRRGGGPLARANAFGENARRGPRRAGPEVRRRGPQARKRFHSWDDGNYRDGVIKPAWDKKREELETARRELAEAQKDLADLPEKARKAGALPGWLRD